MKRHFVALIALLMILLFVPPVQAAADSPPILVIVNLTNGFDHVGELLREDSGSITILDLRTGKERTIEKSSIRNLKRDISDSEAIGESSLSGIMAWKVKKLDIKTATVGRIAKVSDSTIYLTLGTKDGLNEGEKILIYRNNGDITDPVSKKVIAQDRPRIAEVLITEAKEAYSKAKLLGDLEIKLQVGDECEVPGLKLCVAVLPLVDGEGKTEAGQALTEELTTSLVQRGVPVVERTLMVQSLTELALQNTFLFDEKKAQQIGKLAGASCVLTGKIVTEQNHPVAYIRLIDVLTGKIMLAASQRMAAVVTAPAKDGNSAVSNGNGTGELREIVVKALIDGDSELWVTEKGLYWKELGNSAKPGLHGGSNEPTYVNGAKWFPEWEKPKEEKGRDSSALWPLSIGKLNYSLEVLAVSKTPDQNKIYSRDPVTIRKESEAQVISIPDSQPGSMWYTIRLYRDKH